MPTVFEWKGWQFLFYSTDRTEPPHIHVLKDRKEAKFWLTEVRMTRNRRCTDKEINDILGQIRSRRAELLESWHEHFGD